MLGKKSAITISIIFSIVIFLIEFLLVVESYARPASPVIHLLRQPDGLEFEARQWGDERLHGWETLDGYTVVFNEILDRWTHAVLRPDGRLESSWTIVGLDFPPIAIPKYLRPTIPELSSRNQSAPFKAVNPTGVGKIPAVLINFNNTSTTFTPAEFNTLLFGTGNFSMKDYYEEVSYGAFTVSGEVAGWHTALQSHDYYGANDFFGNDKWPGDLVYEAVAAAEAAGFNFASYDTDGDCYVDIVSVVHQGTDEADTGNKTDIWAHQWSLSEAKQYGYSHYGEYTTNDPCQKGGFIKVDTYVILSEKNGDGSMATIGGFAHEYGHVLGLPDLYDTDYSSWGAGFWSLMSAGSYNGVSKDGDRPAHLDAWSKYYLGWVAPTQVIGTLPNESIAQAATAADIYQLGSGTPTSGEYFLVENRGKAGFDAGLPGAGLLIWHIDGDAIANRMGTNSVNDKECYPGGPSCSSQHYGVALIQADGEWELEKGDDLGDTGDPFPGSTNNRSLSNITSPASNLYNGGPSGVNVTGISDSGAIMTATLSFSPPPPPAITITTPNGGETWRIGTRQTIYWTYTGNPGDKVKIEAFKEGFSKTIISSASIGSGGSGSYNWIILFNIPTGSDYKVRVTSTTHSSYMDTSDGFFTIKKRW